MIQITRNVPDWLMARPIAHRGLHVRANGVIENSGSAADAAIAGGFAIECDVQPSADGEAMVFHDYKLDRLTAESGAIWHKTSAELAKIVLRDSTDTILPLPDFLVRINGRTPLVIEIKSLFDRKMELAERTAHLVAQTKAPIGIKSFESRYHRAFAPAWREAWHCACAARHHRSSELQ